VVQDDGLPGLLAAADGVAGAWSHTQAEAWVASLANMRSGDFVFFVAYPLAGLVPPLSSFFLTLLEYYGLQL
jgi:hypothetical protein